MEDFRPKRWMSCLTTTALLVLCAAQAGRAQSAPANRLTAEAHNEVVKAAMDNYKQIAEQLDLKTRKSQGGSKPSGKEVLEAMLRVPEISANTKSIVRATLKTLPAVQRGEKRQTPSSRRTLADIDRQLAGAETTEQLIQRLQEMKGNARYQQGGLAAGIGFAQEILRKGASDIYSPSHHFYQNLAKGQSGVAAKKASDIGKEDAKGAVGGAISGAITGPGVLVGAGVGAIGASVAEVVAQVWDWIFD